MTANSLEHVCLWAALVGYALAAAIAMYGLVFRKAPERTLLGLMALAWALHTLAIGYRWDRLGHIPFIGMFEILSANIWGLMAAVVVAYWRLPRLRPIVSILLPVVMMLMGWMLLLPAKDSTLPYTFHNIWLYIHVAFIKLFLGAAFVALGISTVILMRRFNLATDRFSRLPPNNLIDGTAYRCMALALIFDTLGIVAGSIWAQDAWGRYWQWDALEVWSLVTWLSIGLGLHVRASFRPSPETNSLLVIATFIIAFLTFFGIPFVSDAFHKGTF